MTVVAVTLETVDNIEFFIATCGYRSDREATEKWHKILRRTHMKLGKEDIPKLEQFWINYDNLKGQLLYRRYEILYQPEDTNQGGGKSNIPSNPVESEVVKLHQDMKYRNLQATIQAIEDVYRMATPEQKGIIDYRYWEKDLLIYEWEDIAHELTKRREDDKVLSQYSVIRMRNQIMRDTAKRIGWIHFD